MFTFIGHMIAVCAYVAAPLGIALLTGLVMLVWRAVKTEKQKLYDAAFELAEYKWNAEA